MPWCDARAFLFPLYTEQTFGYNKVKGENVC